MKADLTVMIVDVISVSNIALLSIIVKRARNRNNERLQKSLTPRDRFYGLMPFAIAQLVARM